MARIFPLTGDRDEPRFSSLNEEDREYMWFCLEFCDQILTSRPTHLEALESAANHLTALGYYVDGLGIDQQLVKLKPNDPGILYNLACSFALTGKQDDAIGALQDAIDNGYSNIHHMSADQDLASLRGDPRFCRLISPADESHC